MEKERQVSLHEANQALAASLLTEPKPARVLSGQGAPIDGTGLVGDLYFDAEARVWHGPKTETGWGVEIKTEAAKPAAEAKSAAANPKVK